MKQVNRLIAISIYVENGVVGGSVRYEFKRQLAHSRPWERYVLRGRDLKGSVIKALLTPGLPQTCARESTHTPHLGSAILRPIFKMRVWMTTRSSFYDRLFHMAFPESTI